MPRDPSPQARGKARAPAQAASSGPRQVRDYVIERERAEAWFAQHGATLSRRFAAELRGLTQSRGSLSVLEDALATLLGLSPRPLPKGAPSVGYGQVEVYEKRSAQAA